jgi:hypothetical protein
MNMTTTLMTFAQNLIIPSQNSGPLDSLGIYISVVKGLNIFERFCSVLSGLLLIQLKGDRLLHAIVNYFLLAVSVSSISSRVENWPM